MGRERRFAQDACPRNRTSTPSSWTTSMTAVSRTLQWPASSSCRSWLPSSQTRSEESPQIIRVPRRGFTESWQIGTKGSDGGASSRPDARQACARRSPAGGKGWLGWRFGRFGACWPESRRRASSTRVAGRGGAHPRQLSWWTQQTRRRRPLRLVRQSCYLRSSTEALKFYDKGWGCT